MKVYLVYTRVQLNTVRLNAALSCREIVLLSKLNSCLKSIHSVVAIECEQSESIFLSCIRNHFFVKRKLAEGKESVWNMAKSVGDIQGVLGVQFIRKMALDEQSAQVFITLKFLHSFLR